MCRDVRLLPFDFYLPEHNTCIEFDGEFHFKSWSKSKNSIRKYEDTKRRDKIKTEYCIKNSIRLIRIPYWESENIPTIMESILCTDPQTPEDLLGIPIR